MESSPTSTLETFFPVSTRKLVLTSLSTFGLYQIYWMYQNWRIIKYRDHRKISPPWRSVLGLFFLYPILKRVRALATREELGALPTGAIFICWALLSVINYFPSPIFTALSFCSVFALVPVQRTANLINARADPTLSRNDRFGWLNWVALLLGGPIFVLSLLALAIQSVQT